ncbi:MAG: hypothetical protein K9N48_01395 [Verrucomicrobia bacterium]|nr:hypothetical protein [Verrucomicrobiota bacterium]
MATSLYAGDVDKPRFYVPGNPDYTIVDSMVDSLEFTLNLTLTNDGAGNLCSKSSFVDPDGEIMGWHDFGNLEGPGWAANAVGGAYEIYIAGRLLERPHWRSKALSILDHVLKRGFIDEETGFIIGYRDTETGEFCLNYKHRSDWFCPGSMAKIGYQLLVFADALGHDERAVEMRHAALKCAEWIDANVPRTPNGWFPRRITRDGEIFMNSPDGGKDPLWQGSADGLFIIQLNAALAKRGLKQCRAVVRNDVETFMELGGVFGSINHDTYDEHENVAYSVAFRTLLLAADVLEDEPMRRFAFDKCLAGLDKFKMTDNRNGVQTKGLLYMEDSWDTAYLWENAEAALAYFEAANELRKEDPAASAEFELTGLTILRAIAEHHYGANGFLTEGVDWNNHVGQQHHINQDEFGTIQYTEPFLNNQHIVEPTVYYLTQFAERTGCNGAIRWSDMEGNSIFTKQENLH